MNTGCNGSIVDNVLRKKAQFQFRFRTSVTGSQNSRGGLLSLSFFLSLSLFLPFFRLSLPPPATHRDCCIHMDRTCSSAGIGQNQTGFYLSLVQHRLNKENCFGKRKYFLPFSKIPQLSINPKVQFIQGFFKIMLSLCVYYHLYATTPSYLSLSLSL